ncbi:unnamed protein product, partial [Brassica rapa subsp. trilocularis]
IRRVWLEGSFVCFCYVHENVMAHRTNETNVSLGRSIFLLLMFAVPVLIPVILHY